MSHSNSKLLQPAFNIRYAKSGGENLPDESIKSDVIVALSAFFITRPVQAHTKAHVQYMNVDAERIYSFDDVELRKILIISESFFCLDVSQQTALV